MGYRKGYYNGKYKKRNGMRYIKGAGSIAKTALTALKIAKGVKKLINVEFKEANAQANGTSITNSGLIVQVTNIAQGSSRTQRDGAQIKIVSWLLNIIITMDSTTIPEQSMRIMLVQDKQTNQAIYTIANLLEDATTGDNLVSPLNLDNKFRFKVYYDKLWCMDTARARTHCIKIYKKDLNIKIRYDASVPDITDLTSNSLSIVLISNTATTPPIITFFNRLRFIDN